MDSNDSDDAELARLYKDAEKDANPLSTSVEGKTTEGETGTRPELTTPAAAKPKVVVKKLGFELGNEDDNTEKDEVAEVLNRGIPNSSKTPIHEKYHRRRKHSDDDSDDNDASLDLWKDCDRGQQAQRVPTGTHVKVLG